MVRLSKNEIKGNNIYLVQNGDSVWVKRVKIDWNEVELISDNKEEYSPIRISAEEAQNLQIIGQVVYIGHSLILNHFKKHLKPAQTYAKKITTPHNVKF